MRSTRDRTVGQASRAKTMKTWNELKYYAGLDWAKNHHDVVIVDREGTIVAEFGFEHSAQGWEKFRQSIKSYPQLGVALETNHGIVVDQRSGFSRRLSNFCAALATSSLEVPVDLPVTAYRRIRVASRLRRREIF